MKAASGNAFARAALAGNPSDGYGGRTLAVSVLDFAAEVSVAPDAEDDPTLEPGVLALADAARRRFTLHTGVPADGLGVVSARTTVPREVGLGGSSALVTATLRALCAASRVRLEPGKLARIAHEAEAVELGIAAGMQDRVTQAFESLVFMDFDPALEAPRYEPLDPELLPPLYLAWRDDAAAPSGAVHGDLRERWRAGEKSVRSAMAALAALAASAREALLVGDADSFGRCVDGSFDVRRALLPDLDPRHVRMVEAARSCGAAANYAGSGGAVVGPRLGASPADLEAALAGEGCRLIEPALPTRG
jgi:glucuronokinase